jgi:hypothetical protein
MNLSNKIIYTLSDGISNHSTYYRPKCETPAELPGEYVKCTTLLYLCGPGSVVGIVIGYELDGPGIESRRGRDFP